MSKLDGLHKMAQPLYAFVYKYFENIRPEMLAELRYDFVLSPVEVFERVQRVEDLLKELVQTCTREKEIMDLWAHKELLLHALVVLTNLNLTAQPLEQKGRLAAAVQLRDRLIDDFSQKAVEDPNVLHAIQVGTIDEEIEKRRKARELYNFKPLFEQHGSMVIDPEGVDFKDIPDKF
ncbi:MAG: hypothetical protein ACAI44_20175 [Candidatus Sericytochromatia bacterium]